MAFDPVRIDLQRIFGLQSTGWELGHVILYLFVWLVGFIIIIIFLFIFLMYVIFCGHPIASTCGPQNKTKQKVK